MDLGRFLVERFHEGRDVEIEIAGAATLTRAERTVLRNRVGLAASITIPWTKAEQLIKERQAAGEYIPLSKMGQTLIYATEAFAVGRIFDGNPWPSYADLAWNRSIHRENTIGQPIMLFFDTEDEAMMAIMKHC